MIKWVSGDILKTDAELISVPVNLKGTLGKGLAKQVRDRFPGSLESYRNLLSEGYLGIGRVCIDPPFLWFPTKKDWRDPSELDWVIAGLRDTVIQCNLFQITSAAIPKLGCGLGGLKWEDVRKQIILYLDKPKTEFQVYGEP